jgi:hypothetical protein
MKIHARNLFQFVITAILMGISSVAMAGDGFPGSQPDRRVLKTQEKVDTLFRKGDYERAYFIYRNDLAPLGDKYAQYMVGFMKISGKGVERDYIEGSAWYRLAAERGEANFTSARDDLLQLFNGAQRQQSDEKYKELRLEYSDAMIVAKLIEGDLKALEKLRSSDNTLTLSVDNAALNRTERLEAAEQAEENIAARLQYLRNTVESAGAMSDEELSRIRDLEQRAGAVLD